MIFIIGEAGFGPIFMAVIEKIPYDAANPLSKRYDLAAGKKTASNREHFVESNKEGENEEDED